MCLSAAARGTNCWKKRQLFNVIFMNKWNLIDCLKLRQMLCLSCRSVCSCSPVSTWCATSFSPTSRRLLSLSQVSLQKLWCPSMKKLSKSFQRIASGEQPTMWTSRQVALKLWNFFPLRVFAILVPTRNSLFCSELKVSIFFTLLFYLYFWGHFARLPRKHFFKAEFSWILARKKKKGKCFYVQPPLHAARLWIRVWEQGGLFTLYKIVTVKNVLYFSF